MSKTKNERLHERFKYLKSIQIYLVQPSPSLNIYQTAKTPFRGRAQNISEGGLKLKTPIPLKESDILIVDLALEMEKSFDLYAKVVWVKEDDCGMRFIITSNEVLRTIRNLDPLRGERI